MNSPVEVVRFLVRNSRRIAISVAGGVVLLAGLVMLALPGPGLLVVALGFAILGTEYAWAAAALERTKKATRRAGQAAKSVVPRRRRVGKRK
ncbi:MAG: PGPGW domain-containing protein [Acidimicrobiales bacterium]